MFQWHSCRFEVDTDWWAQRGGVPGSIHLATHKDQESWGHSCQVGNLGSMERAGKPDEVTDRHRWVMGLGGPGRKESVKNKSAGRAGLVSKWGAWCRDLSSWL